MEEIDEDGNIIHTDINGRLHREDGPAYEGDDGYKEWRINGKLHRLDGPAREWPSGEKAWYINGKLLSEAEHKHLTKPCKCPDYLK